jgi:hypothetical protein
MKIHMTRVLRFWVDVEYERIKNHASGRTRTDLVAQILRKFEEAGEAMRYLNTKGEIAWKATPGMLIRLADAEQEARDDELAEWFWLALVASFRAWDLEYRIAFFAISWALSGMIFVRHARELKRTVGATHQKAMSVTLGSDRGRKGA